MSGQQIGSVVGFVVGAYFGNPQLGAMIGGMIGGWVSPTEIEGPHIGDGQRQTSQEGVPIPWVLGTYGWIQGNIVDKSARREVRKEDDGKGSGQVQVTYEAHQDYCIMVCESSETRDSTVVGPLIVKIDGKIVYDMRPGKNFGAENAKFLKNHTFYTGSESQMPDATLEAIHGIGNTPHYRGVFTCVARDINLSQYGDRIPIYEWVMAAEGEQDDVTEESFVGPVYGKFANADFPLASPESLYTLTGYRNTGSEITSFSAGTISEIIEHFKQAGYAGVPSENLEYLAYSASTSTHPSSLGISSVTPQLDVTSNISVVLVYNENEPVEWIDVDSISSCPVLPYEYPGFPQWYGFRRGEVGQVWGGWPPTEGLGTFNHCTNFDPVDGHYPRVQGSYPLYIVAVAKSIPPDSPPTGDPCTLGVPVALPDDASHVIDCDGNVFSASAYSDAPVGSYVILQAEQASMVSDRIVYSKYAVGPALKSGDSKNNQEFWEAAYNGAVARGSMPPDLVYGEDYPESVSYDSVYKSVIQASSIVTDSLSAASAIQRICVRGDLELSQVDTDDVDQTLLGYAITNAYNGADSIRPLLTAYGLYGADYDGKIHFHKLGEDADIAIDPDEMIAGETQTDQAERDQQIEYPRKILLNYIDPTQDYVARPQMWQRTSPDIRAVGEEAVQVPVVMLPDDAARTADTYGKRSTARAQGTRKFSMPFAGSSEVYLRLHPGKSFGLDGKRWVIDKLSLEDGEIAIEASYDRQSAYTSSVTAVPAPDPTPPPSSIGGVTLFAAMNLPRLRSKDNSPGMYIAVAGLLESWPGCVLQMSIDDGATWTTAFPSMTQESVLGYLTAPLAIGGGTLSVAVHGGELNSITDAQFTIGRNPCAIITDGVSELVQFKTATEIEAGEYELTGLGLARLDTTEAEHAQGDRFVHLGNVYFLPIDIQLSGRTIKFRPVTFGTIPENNAVYDVVFSPLFTGPQVIEAYVNDTGDPYVNESGAPYYRIIS